MSLENMVRKKRNWYKKNEMDEIGYERIKVVKNNGKK